MSSEFLVSPGHYPEAYTFDRYLQRIESARAGLELAIYSAYFPDDNPAYTAKQLASFNDNPALWLMSAIDTDILSAKSVRNYQFEPALLIINTGNIYREGGLKNQFVVDIANSGQRIIRKEGNSIFTAANAAVLSGSWATRLEEIDFKSAGASPDLQWNTRKAFQLAKEKGIPLKLLLPDQQQELMELENLNPETRQELARDLQKGYMVIVPESQLRDDNLAGWWRIHPETGETLGMISGGHGGVLKEYLITMTAISLFLSGVLAAGLLASCLAANKCSSANCFKTAGIGFLLGFALAEAMGLILFAVIPETVAVGGGVVVAGGGLAEVGAFAGGIVLDALDGAGIGPVSQIVPQCNEW